MLIDAHTHIYPEKIAEKATSSIGDFYELPMAASIGNVEGLLNSGKAAGVDRYLICSVATSPLQTRTITNYIKTEVDLHPEFFGLGAYHQDNIPKEEIEYIISSGLKGIKIHPDFQKCAIDDEKFCNLYEEMGDKLPILIHMGDKRYDYSHPKRLANVLNKFPKLKVIAAHLGGYQAWGEAVAELTSFVKKGNIRFDESSSLAFLSKEKAKEIIRHYGAENIFWGSDFPMWSHKSEVELIESLGLNSNELDWIFYKSITEFFGL
ncbi:MAG: amidohydrolase [Oscillospiraceae bacterium]|jgi:predicted TIM-barrel fold metal-dependent hydrolase|nr:amidohydrolase [Oscillospiraceae bacterium]